MAVSRTAEATVRITASWFSSVARAPNANRVIPAQAIAPRHMKVRNRSALAPVYQPGSRCIAAGLVTTDRPSCTPKMMQTVKDPQWGLTVQELQAGAACDERGGSGHWERPVPVAARRERPGSCGGEMTATSAGPQ
jgi:hypothetical protein